MNKEKVELLIDEKRQLWVRKADGTEYRVDFRGHLGYGVKILLRTEAEIAEEKQRWILEADELQQENRQNRQWWEKLRDWFAGR